MQVPKEYKEKVEKHITMDVRKELENPMVTSFRDALKQMGIHDNVLKGQESDHCMVVANIPPL